MPKYSKEHEKEFMGKIRKILVYNQKASILTIQKVLSDNGLNLDKDYVNKILNKIRRERAFRYNQEARLEALAKLEDCNSELNEELLRIIRNPDNQMAKIAAIRQIYNQLKDFMLMRLDLSAFKNEEADQKEALGRYAAAALKALHEERVAKGLNS
jgi:hypothetical protein